MSAQESDFGFEVGDTVLVRVREHGTRGNIVAKFTGECVEQYALSPLSSSKAAFSIPWGSKHTTIDLAPYEAEFEVVQ